MPPADVLLREHVTLQCECLDRIYLNGYIPSMQVPGQLVGFLRHRGHPIPSPVLLGKMTQQFVQQVNEFAEMHDVPIVRFSKKQRKEEVAQRHFQRLQAAGRCGVAMIGVAQERVTAFKASKLERPGSAAWFSYTRASACVNQYWGAPHPRVDSLQSTVDRMNSGALRAHHLKLSTMDCRL